MTNPFDTGVGNRQRQDKSSLLVLENERLARKLAETEDQLERLRRLNKTLQEHHEMDVRKAADYGINLDG